MDFDSKTVASTALFNKCWLLDPSGDFQWTHTADGTTSLYTGPMRAHSLDSYFYTEATSPRAMYDTAILAMKCTVDTSSSPSPQLKFYYHMYGSDMGSLSVDVYKSSTGTWISAEWTRAGQQHISSSSPWSLATVILPREAGLMIRFRGVIGAGYFSDMAIDSVRITFRYSTLITCDTGMLRAA